MLDRLGEGEQVSAPAHWPIEVSNALLTAVRRKRIQQSRAELFLDKLASLPILVELSLSAVQVKAVFALCTQHGLTFYDGTYLELAARTGLPLATLDVALLRAAPLAGVTLIP